MGKIAESEFKRICEGIAEDRASIILHNPIGSDAEVLLWMLLNCLNSYLSLEENEAPCFTGKPDELTYRKAIVFILKGRTTDDFDPEPYLDRLISE